MMCGPEGVEAGWLQSSGSANMVDENNSIYKIPLSRACRPCHVTTQYWAAPGVNVTLYQ